MSHCMIRTFHTPHRLFRVNCFIFHISCHSSFSRQTSSSSTARHQTSRPLHIDRLTASIYARIIRTATQSNASGRLRRRTADAAAKRLINGRRLRWIQWPIANERTFQPAFSVFCLLARRQVRIGLQQQQRDCCVVRGERDWSGRSGGREIFGGRERVLLCCVCERNGKVSHKRSILHYVHVRLSKGRILKNVNENRAV